MKTDIATRQAFDTERMEQLSVFLLVAGITLMFQWWTDVLFWFGVGAIVLASVGTLISQILQKRRVVRIVERMAVVGMMVGIVGMLQPWQIWFYENGFYLLLVATISFIVVSHIE